MRGLHKALKVTTGGLEKRPLVPNFHCSRPDAKTLRLQASIPVLPFASFSEFILTPYSILWGLLPLGLGPSGWCPSCPIITKWIQSSAQTAASAYYIDAGIRWGCPRIQGLCLAS